MRRIMTLIWQALGSPYSANIIALITLTVTIGLTYYIFKFTNKQQESVVQVQIDITPGDKRPIVENADPSVPTTYTSVWYMTLTFYNAGPSNITAADLTLNLSSKEGIRLIGIEGKDFAAAISQPIWWMTPQATPWPSEFGYYSFPIKDFERGDYFYVFLLFEVDDLLDSIIRKQRDALGFEVVEHPSFVGAYAYDRSNVNNEAYMEFVRMFINKITLSGQYINVIGEVP